MQEVSCDDGSSFAKVAIILLAVTIVLISRYVSAKNSQDKGSADRVTGTVIPHYVPVNPKV